LRRGDDRVKGRDKSLRLSTPVTVNETGRYTVADRGFVSCFSNCIEEQYNRRNRSVRLPHRQIQRDTGRTGLPPVAPGNNHHSFRADARNGRKRREGSRGGMDSPRRRLARPGGFTASPWSLSSSRRRRLDVHLDAMLHRSSAAWSLTSSRASRRPGALHLPGAHHG
jgi:hypothetical protein